MRIINQESIKELLDILELRNIWKIVVKIFMNNKKSGKKQYFYFLCRNIITLYNKI
jgi:hypothetical protein